MSRSPGSRPVKAGKALLYMTIFAVLLSLYIGVCAGEGTAATISGVVYVDQNGNGSKDNGEPGLPNVGVSDGISVVTTGSNGTYTLTYNNTSAHFVYVSVPSGYKSTAPFYKQLPAQFTQYTADFPLVWAPKTTNLNFSFVQITDLHVESTGAIATDLAEIKTLGPAFIIATGDLVQDGNTTSQYDAYKSALASISTPVVNVMGNHDRPVANYESYLGPTRFSFDYGGCHFVVINCITWDADQWNWLSSDLSLLSGGKRVFAFQHYPPSKELLDILAGYNTAALFHGDWHSSKLFKYRGITVVSTPPLTFSGIDTSPRIYKEVSVSQGTFTLTDHYAGCREYATIVSPANGATVSRGAVSMVTSAYDATSRVKGVEYSVDKRSWKRMTNKEGWAWRTRTSIDSMGTHTIRVRITFRNGKILTKTSQFYVSNDQPPAPQTGADWPMFKRDSGRNGAAVDSVAPPLRLAWSKSLGGNIHVSSPVVSNGTVYIGVADEEFGGHAGVYALETQTGEVKWIYRTISSIKHTVSASNGMVYAVDVLGNVVALNAGTGALQWSFSLGSAIDRWVYTSPVVKDGVVYVGCASVFVALDALTGRQIWLAPSMGGALPCLASPTAGSTTIHANALWGDGVYALRMDTGANIWRKQYTWVISTPAYSQSALYYTGDNALYAVQPETGTQLWSFALANPTISSPTVSGSTLYIGGPDGKMYAINTANGNAVWSYQTGSGNIAFGPYARGGSIIVSSPTVSGNTVYFGSANGNLYALDKGTGSELWKYDLGAPVTSSPAVSGNAVYIASFDGTVYAFSP